MSGYPAGAEFDMNAPWNQVEEEPEECDTCEGMGEVVAKTGFALWTSSGSTEKVEKVICPDCKGTGND